MSSPENLKNTFVDRKRKRQLADEFEWSASVIEHQEVKQEAQDEQDDNERLRQRQERKKAVKARKQRMLEKANELRNDDKNEEPYIPDSDVEIIENGLFAQNKTGNMVSRIDSGCANHEVGKDIPIPSVELSPAPRTPAPSPPVTAPPYPLSAPASSAVIVAAITSQAQSTSSQPLFAPILPPMTGLKKYEAAKRQKSGAERSSGQVGTSSNKRTNFLSTALLHFSLCSQFSPSSQSEGAASEGTQLEAGKDVLTSVSPPKPPQIMLAPSRNTKRLTSTPKNTPAAPEEALAFAIEPVPETASRPVCKTVTKSRTASTKRGPGRPKGVKNKPKPAQQPPVADGAVPFPQQQEKIQENQELVANELSRSSSYLEVEAAAPRSSPPSPNPSLARNRKSRRAAEKEAKRTADKLVAAAKKADSFATATRASNSEGAVLAENPRVRTQATSSGWTAANHVPNVADYSAPVPQVMVVCDNSELRVILDEEAASRAQENGKKGDELRALQQEGEVIERDTCLSGREAEQKADQGAARHPQPETKGKGVRRLDEEAARRKKKRSRAGRNASVIRHGTPLPNSGTTREIERMKKMSIVVATHDINRAMKSQTTKAMLTPVGSAAQAQLEKKKEKVGARVCGKQVAETRERTVAPQKIDVLMNRERSPNDSLHEDLLDAIDKLGKAKADGANDMGDRIVVPTPSSTQTPLEQSSEASIVEPEQQLLVAPVHERRSVPMVGLPTPPSSQELLQPSIESSEQEENAVTQLREAGSSAVARLATPAGTIAALPATPSFRPSGGPSAVMFGVISRLTINLPEEMQEKVVEYVLCMEKTIPELPISPMIYAGHITTPFFQVKGHPSAMWHEVITTLAIDLSEEEQKAVVEYVLVLQKNKKQSLRSKTIG